MTLVMAYCVLLSATVAAVATLGDYLLRSRRLASRWFWLTAIVLVVPMTAFVMLVPRASRTLYASATVAELPLVTAARAPSTPVEATSSWLPVADVALTMMWVGASLLLFSAIGIGRWRVRREKARARRGQVQGHEVLLTSDLGPAVAGVRQPMVFVPEWVVALDDASQRLLIAHEVEHVRRRDTGMLLAGALVTALVPWNPAAWWLARRLRIAVELDCDARVLAAHPGVRRYADLLLVAAGKPKFRSRLLAAHFGEHASDLEWRIDAMTNRRWKVRSMVLAGVAAAGLTMASCETPRPEPVAPVPTGEKDVASTAVTESRAGSAELASIVKRCTLGGGAGCQMSVIVRSSEGNELARYAGEIPVAQVSEGSIQSIEVEKAACGNSSCSLIWITLKPGAVLKKSPVVLNELRKGVDGAELKIDDQVLARRRVYELEKLRAVAERIDSTSVAIQSLAKTTAPIVGNFVFRDTTRSLQGSVNLRQESPVILRDTARARMYLRDESAPSVTPTVVIYSSTGKVVREIAADVTRIRSSSSLDDIKPDDIAAVEVYKGNACASASSLGCPLVKITLKPGRETAYRKR